MPTPTQGAFMSRPSYRTTAEDWYRNGGHVRASTASRFLQELCEYQHRLMSFYDGKIPRTWLLKFRQEFRQLEEQRAALVMQRFISLGDPALRHVFIWLLSKVASRFFLRGLDEYCDDPSPVVRKHLAKALRRLEAWPLLEKMATAHPDDERLRWFATAPTTKRPFRDRLRDFRTTLDDSRAAEVVTPSQMPFWAQEKSWSRTAPKSAAMIRRMLRRIRHWVRWGVSGM
jgi:hypothetical protein